MSCVCVYLRSYVIVGHGHVMLGYKSREGWRCSAEVPRSIVYAEAPAEPWTIQRAHDAVVAYGQVSLQGSN